MRFFLKRDVAAVALSAACVLVQAGPALGQSNPTPADQLRQMVEIIQKHGTPALKHLGRSVEGSKQCLMTDNVLRRRHLAAYGKTVESVMYDGKTFFIEENITSSAERGTYHLSKTFQVIQKGNVVEITEPSPVVLLETTPNLPAENLSLQQIAQAPDVIFEAYHAQETPAKLFHSMRVAVYGACLKVEPPSFDNRAGTYDAPAVAGIFPLFQRQNT